jgi:hypothetical protein
LYPGQYQYFLPLIESLRAKSRIGSGPGETINGAYSGQQLALSHYQTLAFLCQVLV